MTRYISVRKTQEHKPAEQPSCLERREVNAVHLLIAMAFGMLIYIFLKAMLALGEEAAITVSSLTTDLPNSWAKNDTEEYLEEPRLLKLTQSCLGEHHSYCINGLCTFHSELRKPICRCLTGYDGERCEHLTLNSYAHNSYEQYIAVGIGTGMLLSGIIAILYCYVRKRCRKLKSPYKV